MIEYFTAMDAVIEEIRYILGEWADDYDVDAIAREAIYDPLELDECELAERNLPDPKTRDYHYAIVKGEEFWEIVARHEITNNNDN